MGRKIGGWAPFAGSVGTISFNTSANATHPGLFVVNCQMSALSKYGLWQGNFAVGGGEISCTWIISASYASSSSERYKLKVGLSEEYFTGAPFLGFSYAYNENSGKLICGGGNTTTGFTGVFPTFQVFRVVVSADGTSATYYAGAKISTLSSIATAATGLGAGTILGPAFFVGWNTDPAPAVNFFLDYVSVTNTFTTPR